MVVLLKAILLAVILGIVGLLIGPFVALLGMTAPEGACGMYPLTVMAFGAICGAGCGGMLGFLLGLII